MIAVRTPPTTLRAEARQLVRLALKQVLALKLACPLAEIELTSQPGQALKLLHSTHHIGLSISHESGLSIAAINMHGKVGIDLMAIHSVPEQDEMHTLVTDYLGKQTAEYLSGLAGDRQKEAFARAWTNFEARLKCKEKALVEWSQSGEALLTGCSSCNLQVPDGYIAAIAF